MKPARKQIATKQPNNMKEDDVKLINYIYRYNG